MDRQKRVWENKRTCEWVQVRARARASVREREREWVSRSVRGLRERLCAQCSVFAFSLTLILSLTHTLTPKWTHTKLFNCLKFESQKQPNWWTKNEFRIKRGKREKKRRETGFEMFCGSHNFAEMGKKYSGLKQNPEEPKHYFLKLVHCPLLSALVVNSGERSPAVERTEDILPLWKEPRDEDYTTMWKCFLIVNV